MPETGNGGNPNNPPQVSMEKNLLLAFLLMGAVMFLSQYFFKSQTPPVPPKTSATETAAYTPPAAPTPGTPSTGETAKVEGKGSATATQATAQPPLPPLEIDTDLFHVTISNQGGTVRSWRLKKFRGNDGKELDLVNPAAGLEPPFSLFFPAQKPATDVNWAWYSQTADPDGLGASFRFSDGHTSV